MASIKGRNSCCNFCSGKGYISAHDCYCCNGSGKRWFFFDCDNCNGTGHIPEHQCSWCDGSGWVKKPKLPSISQPLSPPPLKPPSPPPYGNIWWKNTGRR